ncbi:MAG: 3-keto-5-aminohexanoate cleavage protein [Nitrospinota bacterium]
MDKRAELLKKFRDVPPPHKPDWGTKGVDFRVQAPWDVPDRFFVSAAVVGSFVGKDQNPRQPIQPEEVRDAFFAAIEAGAAGIHVHVRGRDGRPTASADVYHEVLDPIIEKYGDDVVIDGGTMTGKTFEECMTPVTEGLYDLCIVNPTSGLLGDRLRAMRPETMKAQAEYYQALGVRCVIDVHEASSIWNAKRHLIDTGLLERPLVWHLLPGLPGTMYLPHVRATWDGVTFLVDRIREIDPESIILSSDAGRGSVYTTAMNHLLGLHLRVGMEDVLYKYPHRNDLIETSAEAVREAIELGKILGKEPMTAREFRALAGLRSRRPAETAR